MKSPFSPHSVAGLGLLVPWAVLFTCCACGQPEYFHLDPVGYCAWPSSHAPLTASVQATHVFTIDRGGGLVSVTVEDPSQPRPLARWDSGAVLLDLAVAGPRACVAAGNQGVHIVGIGDPTRLSRLGGYEPGGFVFALDAAGDRVYVAWQTLEPGDPQPGVQVDIVEITDPAQPVRLGMIALPYDSVRDVQLVGDILYIDADALYAFNVSDPAHLVRTGMTILPPLITAIPVRLRIADERVYRLCHARFSCGVHLYQAPFTVAPYSEFTFWPTRGNAPDIWIQGRYLFVLDSPISFDSPQPPDRVTVLSTADPFHLGRVGQRELSPDAGEARFIRTLDDHVCVGTELGLVILKAAKQPAFLRSAQVQANRFQLVCNDAEGMRLQRSRSLVDPVWEDLGAVNPDQVVLVSMDGGQAFSAW